MLVRAVVQLAGSWTCQRAAALPLTSRVLQDTDDGFEPPRCSAARPARSMIQGGRDPSASKADDPKVMRHVSNFAPEQS
jgi:hypothetical protein